MRSISSGEFKPRADLVLSEYFLFLEAEARGFGDTRGRCFSEELRDDSK